MADELAYRRRSWARKPNNAATQQRRAEYASPAYRAQHEADRRLVTSGQAVCWRCRKPIPPTAHCGRDWHSGHDDNDRRILRGPEHARCNLIAAARKGGRLRHSRRVVKIVKRRALLG